MATRSRKTKDRIMCLEDFEVKSGAVLLTDPCYEKDTWCARSIRAANGRWTGHVMMRGGRGRGGRVASMHVRLKKGTRGLFSRTLDGFCVDSGLFGVFDREDYIEMKPGKRGAVGDARNERFRKIDHLAHPAGALDHGYVSSTGGDGCFEVTVDLDRGRRVIGVHLYLMDEE